MSTIDASAESSRANAWSNRRPVGRARSCGPIGPSDSTPVQRFGLHDHARPAPERLIVHLFVRIVGEEPDIVDRMSNTLASIARPRRLSRSGLSKIPGRS